MTQPFHRTSGPCLKKKTVGWISAYIEANPVLPINSHSKPVVEEAIRMALSSLCNSIQTPTELSAYGSRMKKRKEVLTEAKQDCTVRKMWVLQGLGGTQGQNNAKADKKIQSSTKGFTISCSSWKVTIKINMTARSIEKSEIQEK